MKLQKKQYVNLEQQQITIRIARNSEWQRKRGYQY